MDIRRRMSDALLEREVSRRLGKAEEGFRDTFNEKVLPEMMEKDAHSRRLQLGDELLERDPADLRVEFEKKTLPALLEHAEEQIREAVREELGAS
jgi:hypothetical protein